MYLEYKFELVPAVLKYISLQCFYTVNNSIQPLPIHWWETLQRFYKSEISNPCSIKKITRYIDSTNSFNIMKCISGSILKEIWRFPFLLFSIVVNSNNSTSVSMCLITQNEIRVLMICKIIWWCIRTMRHCWCDQDGSSGSSFFHSRLIRVFEQVRKLVDLVVMNILYILSYIHAHYIS